MCSLSYLSTCQLKVGIPSENMHHCIMYFHSLVPKQWVVTHLWVANTFLWVLSFFKVIITSVSSKHCPKIFTKKPRLPLFFCPISVVNRINQRHFMNQNQNFSSKQNKSETFHELESKATCCGLGYLLFSLVWVTGKYLIALLGQRLKGLGTTTLISRRPLLSLDIITFHDTEL